MRPSSLEPATMEDTLPLAELAFRRLRSDVLLGNFESGSRLKIDELQRVYGYSSSPLREALSRLAQEGLVRADERRGFRVSTISIEDLADITRMRLMLDIPALRESIAAGDDAWEADIVAAYHRLEKVELRLADLALILDDEWSARHREFHASLIAACPSKRQLAWSASLFDQAERYRRYCARYRKTPRRKAVEHRKLMEATLRRDAETACRLLTEHMLETQRNVEAILRSAGPGLQ